MTFGVEHYTERFRRLFVFSLLLFVTGFYYVIPFWAAPPALDA